MTVVRGSTGNTGVLDTIGGTRMLPLKHLAPSNGARILIKLEYENPTGSMKDRMALAMVDGAIADGRLKPGGSVVEFTGGSTGVSLSLICAAKGIPLRIVTSDAFSREKRDHMRALGAELTLIPSPTGGTTKALTLEMIDTARRMGEEPGSCWMDQMNNLHPLKAYARMADEIRDQCGGRIHTFVHIVGTAGSLRGVSTRLREHDPRIRVVAIEPQESAVLSGGPSGSHGIEGTGPGFVVPLWNPDLADELHTVSTAEAMEWARRLAREEGIFAGTSTGANVCIARRIAESLGPEDTVVTIAADSGMKYLSTPLYSGS